MKDAAPHEERSRLTRFFLDNFPLKLLALVLSLALFSLVHTDQDAQRSLYVDVLALLPPPSADKMLVTDLPAQVKVTLRGSRTRISSLQRDDFSPIQMDLRDANRRVFYFDPNEIDVTGAVQVISVEPRAIELVWVQRSERNVPVRARLRGTPEDGHVVQRPVQLTPAMVTLYGPEEKVRGLSEVYTEDIPIDGIGAGKHERRVQLEPLPSHVQYSDQPAVDVLLEVRPEVTERVLRRLEVAVVGAAEASVRPLSVTVHVRGPARALPELEPEQVVPYVDVGALAPGEGTQAAEVSVRGLPEGFEVSRVTPATVLIKRK